MTLLTDYALEVGARITYSVEPAELKPEGSRKYDTWKADVALHARNPNDSFSVQ